MASAKVTVSYPTTATGSRGASQSGGSYTVEVASKKPAEDSEAEGA